MGKEFIPLHLALKLKALGFDYPCFATWNGDVLDMSLQVPSDDYFTKAPTFTQAFRFFREKYGLKGFIIPIEYLDGTPETYQWNIFNECHSGVEQLTYEEAELYCLDKLITLKYGKN